MTEQPAWWLEVQAAARARIEAIARGERDVPQKKDLQDVALPPDDVEEGHVLGIHRQGSRLGRDAAAQAQAAAQEEVTQSTFIVS